MKQIEFRFYDKHPEQLTLDVTQEPPQRAYSNATVSYNISNSALSFADYFEVGHRNLNINLNNIVLEEGEKPSFIKRILLKQLGIKTR
tara:strand:+ start:102 stop:365 length:264 start_codon:yes stop_codon:yes gene_type:complete